MAQFIRLGGYRTYVALTYIGINIVGFIVNGWVLYVVAPLLFAPAVKVPKSILFFIFALCVGDLMIMIAMFLLIIELVLGTWQFSEMVCISYLLIDSMNKFVAPIIVFLISRTCYTTVCLDKARGEKASSLKLALIQVLVAIGLLLFLLWPVFTYSQVITFYIHPNNNTMEVTVMKKCVFYPPPHVEFRFNVAACIISYAIPLLGIIYWYVSVPFFLKRRALTTLVATSSMDAALKKVIMTVLLLTAIYIVCWTPYWISMFAHHLVTMQLIIIFYFIHLLPYVSCVAYPLIFTLLNRGIRTAHARIMKDQRRRFKSLTDDASSTLRTVVKSKNSVVHTINRPQRSSLIENKPSSPDESESPKNMSSYEIMQNSTENETLL
ncbi:hypothetical protein WR25_05091 [Diploscapter pachys]|uniref:G-protein coupled receptors family 1 profile domain-containing protein n=1 Tax=Diploscapter pachys TaxID=2018661 RepID=A0A2A2J8B9_9BILA|nr:hypothetical protein WR25_05091 [Diploscapter pachys]